MENDDRPTKSEVLQQLRNLDRDPFLRVLEKAMANGPDGSDFKRMAKEKPKEWAMTVKILANLGGYTERKEIRKDVFHGISNMSTAQLEDLTRRMEEGEIIDITDYQEIKGE